jgi:hypothetical protein
VGDLTAVRERRGVGAVLRALVALPFVVAGVGSMALTLADMWTLHPYEYVYFNRLGAGGQAEASTRFETDYWGLSYKEGLEWVAANVPPESRPITIANCSQDFLTSYWIKTTPALAARLAPGSPYSNPPARILLATTRYNCHKRPGKTLHVVERDGVPLVYVIEQAPAAP